MTIQATVNLGFKMGADGYAVALNIPSATPSGDAPFLFNVDSVPNGSGTPDKLLVVAIGNSSQIYVAVAPPQSLLAGVAGDVVQKLNVVVAEGVYDQTTQKFTS